MFGRGENARKKILETRVFERIKIEREPSSFARVEVGREIIFSHRL